MAYRGHVEGGVVILERPMDLTEGTEVEVLPLGKAEKHPGEALEKLAGQAKDLPADLADRHDHYRRIAKS